VEILLAVGIFSIVSYWMAGSTLFSMLLLPFHLIIDLLLRTLSRISWTSSGAITILLMIIRLN